jgi:parvulin-like peptidyl-prolyl isomerase
LRDQQVGSWQGPLRSGFGLHFVELTARTAGRNATLEEVRTAVERDLLHARTQEANAAAYDRLRANYAVRIEGGDLAVAEPAG